MNRYKLLNSYFNLVRGGIVEPLRCPDCGQEYSIWIPDHDVDLENPVLRCWQCVAEVTLGTDALKEIEEVVNSKINYL